MYLIINRVYGHVEKNGNKFLTIDKGDSVLKKYDQVFSGIEYHITNVHDNKFGSKFPEVVYDSDYMKINFLSNDSLPLNKLIFFPTITVVIRCVFKRDGVFYPQFYLDDCLYQI